MLVVAGAVLVSCAQLAGISDTPASGDSDASQVVESEAGSPANDGAASSDEAQAGPQLATIVVRCNGAVVAKYACPKKRWEYDFAPCAGTTRKVELENPGAYPIAFIARRAWTTGVKYVPNEIADGAYGEMIGVLMPNGGTVDVSNAYGGGIFAVVGSVHPFDAASLTAPDPYEGKVAYEAAMLGGLPTNGELFAAELTASPFNSARCTTNPVIFTKK